ncbi:Hsp70 family protein [Catenuloplanes japonicus]|uniref:Hsp70 family protein n=1 Tax=Catenuloplanes japonicus TaxID=33876 RepID=UPI00068ABFD6|nr:Hsp70 family protein [Catenuloplanes japonicus]
MNGYQLAIDYGTSHSVAVLRRTDGTTTPLLFDGSPLLASAVLAEADGRFLAGRDAVRAARETPSALEPNPKRRIDELEVFLGARAYPVPRLIAATLARIGAEAERVTGGGGYELTMTCPVSWGPARRRVLVEAAQLAGLPRPALVPEPVAAASYYTASLGNTLTEGGCLLVYDLGAGTFDVTVVQRRGDGFDALAYRGLDDVGGLDLDEVLRQQAGAVLHTTDATLWGRLDQPRSPAEVRARVQLGTDLTEAKETLSRHASARLFVPLFDTTLHLTREEFEAGATPVLQRTVDATLATIRESRIPADRLAGVFLVGGSSRVPLVATLLHRALGVPPTTLEQPETVVATGALDTPAGQALPEGRPLTDPGAPTAATPQAATPPAPAPQAAAPAAQTAAPPIPAPQTGASPTAAPRPGTPPSAAPWTAAPLSAAPLPAEQASDAATANAAGPARSSAAGSQTGPLPTPPPPDRPTLPGPETASTAVPPPPVAEIDVPRQAPGTTGEETPADGRRRTISRRGLLGIGAGVIAAAAAGTAGYIALGDRKQEDPGAEGSRASFTKAWSASTIGHPVETVLVTDGVVIVAGKASSGTWKLHALDPSDGTVRWSQSYTAMITELCAAQGLLAFVCFDDKSTDEQYLLHVASLTDGVDTWSNPYPGTHRMVIVEDTLVINNQEDAAANTWALSGLNLRNGTKNWTLTTSASELASLDRLLMHGVNDSITRRNAQTSEEIWSFPAPDGETLGGMLAMDDFVIVAGATADAAWGTRGRNLYAVAGTDGAARWTYTAPGDMNLADAVLAGGVIAVGVEKGPLVGVDAATGAVRWQRTPEEFPPLQDGGWPWMAGYLGHLFVFGTDRVYALDGATGATLTETSVPGRKGYAVVDGTVYVGDEQGLTAYSFNP